MNFLGDQRDIFRRVRLQIKGRGLVRRTGNIVHGVNGDQFAPAFAVLEDARDSEGTLFNKNRIADTMSIARGCEDIVHDDIVRFLRRTSRYKNEWTQLAIRRVFDSPQYLQPIDHGELLIDRRGHGDMRQCPQNPLHLDGNDRSVDPVEDHGVAGAHNQIGADPVVHPLLPGQLAHHNGDDGQHHDDFNSHGENADE